MEELVSDIPHRLSVLEPIDHFTLGVNLIILLFSKRFATRYGKIKDEEQGRLRLRILHWGNFLLFATYLVAVGFELHLAASFSQSFLVILSSFLLIHFVEAFILRKYGKTRTIDEFSRTTETHTSRTLELVFCTVIFCVAGVLLINIWGFEDWLQTTSVIGFIALFLFASKEYWAGDFLSGIILISQGRLERGDVVRIEEEGVEGIILQIRPLQTVIRDLVDGHDVILPNYKIQHSRVDVLKTDLARGIRNHVDFIIGYDVSTSTVNDYLKAVWEKVLEKSLVGDEAGFVVSLKECADHGVRWRLLYTLKSPRRLIETQDAVREAAYDLQQEHGIELATPTTIRFPDGHFPVTEK